MTAEHHRTMAQQSHLLTRAAASEAVRAGRAEVDVEHVLLALLASGGPSAGLLLRAGVDLAGLRRAAADLQAEDLGAFDRSGLGTAPRPGGAARAVEDGPARSVPVNARVQAVLDDLPLRAQETALLAALLADSPRAGRLLQQQAVDVSALRAALAAPAEARCAAGGAEPEDEAYDEPDPPAPPGWTWEHVEHRQVLPVHAADLWALISDPARRPQWDTRCAAVHIAPDGSERLVVRGANRDRDRDRRQVVTHLMPNRAITWGRPPEPEDVLARAGAAVVRTTSLRLAQDQADSGGSADYAVLHIKASWLVPARRRWLRWPLTRVVRTELRVLAQGIVQAAPGAPAQAPQ